MIIAFVFLLIYFFPLIFSWYIKYKFLFLFLIWNKLKGKRILLNFLQGEKKELYIYFKLSCIILVENGVPKFMFALLLPIMIWFLYIYKPTYKFIDKSQSVLSNFVGGILIRI